MHSQSHRKLNWQPSRRTSADVTHMPRSLSLTAQALTLVDLEAACSPVKDQGQEGSCHDDQTEVLTDSGWKLFANLSADDRLASVNPGTKELFYEAPTRLVQFAYSGPMYYGLHQNADFAVTPDHKMLVRKWDERARTLSSSYDMVDMKDVGWYVGLMTGVQFSGGEKCATYTLPGVEHKQKPQREDLSVPMSAWMKFLGIYLAEGTVLKEEYKIQLAASTEVEKQFIREVMAGIGVRALELDDRFTLSNKQLYLEMTRLGLGGVHAPYKFVPDFVFKLHPDHMKDLLLGHFMGDGNDGNGMRSHFTSSRRLADDLQRLMLLSGDWSVVRSRAPRTAIMKDGREINGRFPEYRIGQWSRDSLSIDRGENVEIEEYDGLVFCAEVPSHHTLITRRNGKMLISGNCTANAVTGAFECRQKLENRGAYRGDISRQAIYGLTLRTAGHAGMDVGSTIHDTMATTLQYGLPLESIWPYSQPLALMPTPDVLADGLANRPVDKDIVVVSQDLANLWATLNDGDPVPCGFTVWTSFMSRATAQMGVWKGRQPGDQVEGGHAVYLIGYNPASRMFKLRNSWGDGWGIRGCFWCPEQEVLGGDFSDFRAVVDTPALPATPSAA